jgi:hypothetical protein
MKFLIFSLFGAILTFLDPDPFRFRIGKTETIEYRSEAERVCVKEPVFSQFNSLSKAIVHIKLTIDTKIQMTLYKALHFSEGPKKSVKNILNYCNKNVFFFVLLNGWNVTKTIVLTTYERKWRNSEPEFVEV